VISRSKDSSLHQSGHPHHQPSTESNTGPRVLAPNNPPEIGYITNIVQLLILFALQLEGSFSVNVIFDPFIIKRPYLRHELLKEPKEPHVGALTPAESNSPYLIATMAATTGNQGWAQLRQQARSLESQVIKALEELPSIRMTSDNKMNYRPSRYFTHIRNFLQSQTSHRNRVQRKRRQK